MTAASSPAGASISARSLGTRLLPYLLSLPALLVCVGILIPFGTAVGYSLERYNLAFPMTRGLIWYGNYLDFLTDPAFWNTLKVSLLYTALTVGIEWDEPALAADQPGAGEELERLEEQAMVRLAMGALSERFQMQAERPALQVLGI